MDQMFDDVRPCPHPCVGCEALRQAVPAVVAQVGIKHVTVDDLAGAVGMAPAVARRHASLEHLIVVAYCTSAANLHGLLFGGFRSSRSWEQGLRRGLSDAFEALNADPSRAIFGFQEVPQGDPALRGARESMRRASLVLWRQHQLVYAEDRPLSSARLEHLHGAVLNRVNVSLRRGALHELDDRVVDELVLLGS
jgi:hypothetical protein